MDNLSCGSDYGELDKHQDAPALTQQLRFAPWLHRSFSPEYQAAADPHEKTRDEEVRGFKSS
jgi:hypothetical protein